MQALLAGEVDLIFDTTLGIIPQVQANRLRPIMTTSPKPLTSMPQVPSMDSLFPSSGIQGWHGIFTASATPKDVLNTLSEAIQKAVNSPEMSAKLRELGLEPSGMGSERFTEVVHRDLERWGTCRCRKSCGRRRYGWRKFCSQSKA